MTKLTIGKFMEAVLSERSYDELDKARKDELKYLKEFSMQMVIRETAVPESRCSKFQFLLLQITIQLELYVNIFTCEIMSFLIFTQV